MKEYDNLKIVHQDKYINIYNENKCVRISARHEVYLDDIKRLFDFYFNSVEAENEGDVKVVDFSHPKLHKIYGYDLHPVMFPSFAEPVNTTQQYLDFANLNENSIVIDLGAYSGLTSILFDMAISKDNKNAKGKVIAVDADLQNIDCIKYNLAEYEKHTGRNIEYINAAIASFDGTVDFSCEGNMGASVVNMVGPRGDVNKIPAIKLSTLAKKFNLKKVDFIKCDIEGSEIEIFKDKDFFKKYSPRIIVETHYFPYTPNLTTDITVSCLKDNQYNCKEVPQDGFDLPLLECTPKGNIQKIIEFLQKIFLVKKENNHKVVIAFGIKIKFREEAK